MTLRSRVLLGLGVIAVVFGATAVAVPRITAAHLLDQVDDQLAAFDRGSPDGERYEGYDSDADDFPDLPSVGLPDELERPSQVYLARFGIDGEPQGALAPNYGDVDAPDVSDPQVFVDHADAGPFTLDGPTRYRFVATTTDDGTTVQVAGLPLDDLDETIDRLIRIEAAALVAVLAVLALVAWWVVRLGVRPVKQMAAAATEIGAGDLSARVPEHAPGTEAGQLGVALNQMLGRLEDEFERRQRTEDRLRQFAADASHELRTPVATVRGYAELHRTGGLEDPEERAEAMRRVEQEAVRMGGLVDDLLRLARLDEGRELERRPVDLAVLVADAARDAQATAPDRPVTVEVDGPVVVAGDERLLRQVVANLAANALVHTDADVAVHLRARVVDGRAVLEVADEGPGMAPEVAERVFERFYRADPSRSRHRGGSGLGLAIVEAVVSAHGGTVSVTTAPGEGTTVRAELPVA